MRRLVIDIGTNSVLGLLVEIQQDTVRQIFDRKVTTRLGDGLYATGKLSRNAIIRTVNAVSHMIAAERFDDTVLLGTEALRVARNRDEFRIALAEATSQDVFIISGQKEAELSFLGALYNLPLKSNQIMLIDVGGGSTEILTAEGNSIIGAISFPVGALKLRDSVETDDLDHYREAAAQYMQEALKGPIARQATAIIATGGTITSVAAILRDVKEFDSSIIHGMELDASSLWSVAFRFQSASYELRKEIIPFDPERADLILPGLGIFLAILGIIQRDSLVVSAGGLRFGAALYPEKIRA